MDGCIEVILEIFGPWIFGAAFFCSWLLRVVHQPWC
jgi:hypothetical protein